MGAAAVTIAGTIISLRCSTVKASPSTRPVDGSNRRASHPVADVDVRRSSPGSTADVRRATRTDDWPMPGRTPTRLRPGRLRRPSARDRSPPAIHRASSRRTPASGRQVRPAGSTTVEWSTTAADAACRRACRATINAFSPAPNVSTSSVCSSSHCRGRPPQSSRTSRVSPSAMLVRNTGRCTGGPGTIALYAIRWPLGEITGNPRLRRSRANHRVGAALQISDMQLAAARAARRNTRACGRPATA